MRKTCGRLSAYLADSVRISRATFPQRALTMRMVMEKMVVYTQVYRCFSATFSASSVRRFKELFSAFSPLSTRSIVNPSILLNNSKLGEAS